MIITVFLLLAGELPQSADSARTNSSPTTTYRCPHKLDITVSSDGPTRVIVRDWSQNEYRLEETESRYGRRYSDSNVILLINGNQASLTIGDVLHWGCAELAAAQSKTPKSKH